MNDVFMFGQRLPWWMLSRVEMARVVEFGVKCCEHGRHFIPEGDVLTVDLNGAPRLCESLLQVIRAELKVRKLVRVVRQLEPQPKRSRSQQTWRAVIHFT